MVFKRRTPKTWAQAIREGLWPKGGWSRAFYYIMHRLRRLPDPPHRIARGVAAGVFVCFTPFFGFHFVISGVLAFAMQGNVIAALMATFVGNPLTFPFIAAISLELGQWMLGIEGHIPLPRVFAAIGHATREMWDNMLAIFTSDVAHWGRLRVVWRTVFYPYLVGGMVPGVFAGVGAYMLTLPAVKAYQARRIKKLRKRFEKRQDSLLHPRARTKEKE